MRMRYWVALVVICATLTTALAVVANPEWLELMRGNTAFRGDSITFGDLKYTRTKLAGGQKPRVTVLACSDSRVPPELVFHRNLGELFVVRAAGNVADTFGVASVEYAIDHKWTKLLVVLAHEKCGAVEAAIGPDPPLPRQTPSLNALVKQIRSSFTGAPCSLKYPLEPLDPASAACWKRRAVQNALHEVDDLKARSALIKKAIDVDHLPVVVAYYNLKSGDIEVLSPLGH